MNKTKLFTLLFFLSIACSSLSAFSADIEPQTQNKEEDKIVTNDKHTKSTKSVVVWNESLTLEDYYLLPEFVEFKTEEEREKYKKTLADTYKQTPSVFSSAVPYGLLLLDLNEMNRARTVWNKAIKDFYSNESVKVYKAWFDAKSGDYQKAKDVWFPIAKEKYDYGVTGIGSRIWLPYHVDAIVGLYAIKDKFAESEKNEIEKIIRAIVFAIPNDPKFATIAINEYLKEGDLYKAATILSQALNANPGNPLLVTLLGVTQLMTNHFDEAVQLFDRGQELYPNGLTNRIMKARALYAQGKEKEAYEAFDQAIKLNPNLSFEGNKRKKFLSQKTYLISKKIKKQEEKIEREENKLKEPEKEPS